LGVSVDAEDGSGVDFSVFGGLLGAALTEEPFADSGSTRGPSSFVQLVLARVNAIAVPIA
jgi:hypothetical protein